MESTEKPKEVSKVSKRGVSVLVLSLLALITVIVLAGWWGYKNYSNKKEATTETPVAGKPILHIDNQPNLATAPCDCGEGKTTRNRGSGGRAGVTQRAKGAAVAVAKSVIDVTPASPATQEAPPSTSTQSSREEYRKPVLDVVDDNYGKPQVEVTPLEESSVTTEIIVIEADSGGYGHHDHHRYERPVYDVPAYVPGSVLREYQASVQQNQQQSQRPVYDVPAYVPGSVLAQQPRYVPPLNGGPNGGGGANGPVNPAP